MTRDHPLDVPVIERPPVSLRPFALDDIDAVIDASSDPLIPKITSISRNADAMQAAEFIRRQHRRAERGEGYSFAIEADSACVGQIGLWVRDIEQGRATVGYWIRPASRGRGYAAVALAAISGWAFETVGVARLQLHIEPGNSASWRTAERVGYEREGLLRSWQLVGDERRDMFVYGLTRDRATGERVESRSR